MAIRDPTDRNLWIIAALVLVTLAVLAWYLNSGAGLPGGEVADVSVEALPGTDAPDDRNDRGVAEAVSDALAPPAAGTPAAGN